MPSAYTAKAGAAGTISDGVDINALMTSNTGIYYGTYDHARSLELSTYGPSNPKDVIKPILWHVMGEEQSGGITLLTDSATGGAVSGSIHRDAVLTVGNIVFGSSAAREAIRQRTNDNQFITLFYRDIFLSRGFTGTLTITLPVESA